MDEAATSTEQAHPTDDRCSDDEPDEVAAGRLDIVPVDRPEDHWDELQIVFATSTEVLEEACRRIQRFCGAVG